MKLKEIVLAIVEAIAKALAADRQKPPRQPETKKAEPRKVENRPPRG